MNKMLKEIKKDGDKREKKLKYIDYDKFFNNNDESIDYLEF